MTDPIRFYVGCPCWQCFHDFDQLIDLPVLTDEEMAWRIHHRTQQPIVDQAIIPAEQLLLIHTRRSFE